jgi:hypothetical protein
MVRSQGGQDMYISSSCPSGPAAVEGLFTPKGAARDDESRLAATLRRTHGVADAPAISRKRISPPPAAPIVTAGTVLSRVVDEIVHAVEARLPGRISGLKVEILEDQFVLRGVSSSYYVKQVAGHLAMTTMDACLLGRLVNEIEVRSVR